MATSSKRQRSTASVRKVSRDFEGVTSLSELYGGGYTGSLLQGKFHTAAVYAWFQARHTKGGNKVIDEDGYCRTGKHEWKVPYGVREAFKTPLTPSQIAHRHPWYVTWVSPKTGKRLKKYFGSLAQAVLFITKKAQYVDPEASIINRQGLDIPPKLRGKFPRKRHYWCPCCMMPRKFKRQYYSTGDPIIFYGHVKVWDEKKGRYIFKDRKLALMKCAVCNITNRDAKFRRSNQPWEVRKIKPGVRRARRRRR